MKTIPKDVAGTIARLQAEINKLNRQYNELKGKIMIEEAKQESSYYYHTNFKRYKHTVKLELSYLLDTEYEPMRKQETYDLFENPKLAECFQGIDLSVVAVDDAVEVPDVE